MLSLCNKLRLINWSCNSPLKTTIITTIIIVYLALVNPKVYSVLVHMLCSIANYEWKKQVNILGWLPVKKAQTRKHAGDLADDCPDQRRWD